MDTNKITTQLVKLSVRAFRIGHHATNIIAQMLTELLTENQLTNGTLPDSR